MQVGWQRAARTDKGVSAVGNVVSLKLMIDFPDVVERINAALPEQVGVAKCALSWRQHLNPAPPAPSELHCLAQTCSLCA